MMTTSVRCYPEEIKGTQLDWLSSVDRAGSLLLPQTHLSGQSCSDPTAIPFGKLTLLDAVDKVSACSWAGLTVTKPLQTAFIGVGAGRMVTRAS
jgi:hypothetical protein